MGQESIDVYYKPLGGGFYHKYIVYTDSDGNRTAARGGPEGKFFGSADTSGTDSGDASNSPSNNPDVYGHGNIDTVVGPFTPPDENQQGGFIDYPKPGENHPSENIATGDDLSSEWESIEQSMTDIENGGYDYDPVPGVQDGHNSNSTVDTALDRAGLPQPTQDGPGDNWSPGSEKIIPPR